MFDLVIVGGGTVGMSLACALQQVSPSLRIALIDARAEKTPDPRLFALNWSSCQLLKNIYLWPLLADYAAPIHTVHVSRRSHFGVLRLDAKTMALPTLGYVIPAVHLEHALQMRLADCSAVTLYRPASLVSLQQTAAGCVLTLLQDDAQQVLHARYVIGADGTHSTVRTLTGITAPQIEVAGAALVTQTQLARHHQGIAYERFTDNGAIAMLPLSEHRCATIWSADRTTIASLHDASDADFLDALQTTFGARLGRFMSTSARATFPLDTMRVPHPVAGSVLLLGNAAHTVHPIAAQGLNMAFYEIATLAEHVTGGTIPLEKISQTIQSRLSVNLAISQRMPHWLGAHSIGMSCLLSLGMLSLDSVTFAKRMILAPLLGRTGRVPRLLLSAGA